VIVALVDYGSGNLRSAAKALERAAVDSGQTHRVVITADPDEVRRADRVVLPGQGAFGACRAGLHAVPGLADAIAHTVTTRGRPFLGICVGMQLCADAGLEHGHHAGFGWIGGAITAMTVAPLKLPHMGWNTLHIDQPDHPFLAGIRTGDYVYWVHSYAWTGLPAAAQLAHTDYGGPVVGIVGHGTVVGTQFHVEKSQGVGLRLLANFLAWAP
jgi:glutamine amidotransferase